MYSGCFTPTRDNHEIEAPASWVYNGPVRCHGDEPWPVGGLHLMDGSPKACGQTVVKCACVCP